MPEKSKVIKAIYFMPILHKVKVEDFYLSALCTADLWNKFWILLEGEKNVIKFNSADLHFKFMIAFYLLDVVNLSPDLID